MDQRFIYVGYVASAITSAQVVPQVWKTFKKKTVEGLSMIFIILLMLNSLSWIIYGIGFISIGENSYAFIMILPSIFSILCCLAEIIAFNLYGKKKTNLLLE
jgi:uncharacterized protein with PQ loop repeat